MKNGINVINTLTNRIMAISNNIIQGLKLNILMYLKAGFFKYLIKELNNIDLKLQKESFMSFLDVNDLTIKSSRCFNIISV